MLQHLPNSYNNSYHISIGVAPVEVNWTNQEEVWQKLYGNLGCSKIKTGLKVGRGKRRFEKGYLPNWSDKIFTVKGMHRSNPPVYRLIEDQNSPIEGMFYEQELQKVSVSKDKLYRVENVLQQRKRGRSIQVLV